jgi:predicted  nucleic acid-binding Zn-ribbon protein
MRGGFLYTGGFPQPCELFFVFGNHILSRLKVMRDIKSLLLLLLSAGLVGTWIYHLYDKTVYSQRIKEIYIKDSAAVAEGITDSLQRIYTIALNDLDSQLDSTRSNSDSLRGQLDNRLLEINKLRNEIGDILKNKNANESDMSLARNKITELQRKISELRQENSSMEDERKRLNNILDQLTTEMKGLEQNVKKLDDENKSLTEKINLASTFVASELKFTAVDIKGAKEQETSQSKKTDKFVVSFIVQNNINDYNTAEVYVTVLQPDGQILQSQVWESGTFASRSGQREFTRKVRFEYLKGEQKRLLFSLEPNDYQKGNYTMSLYHNGTMIGQLVRTLY